MKTFNKKVIVGTKVKLFGIDGLHKIKNIHPTRQWVEVDGYMGSFQVGHIEKYTNAV